MALVMDTMSAVRINGQRQGYRTETQTESECYSAETERQDRETRRWTRTKIESLHFK